MTGWIGIHIQKWLAGNVTAATLHQQNAERWTSSVQSLRTSGFCPTKVGLALLLTVLPFVSVAKETPYLGGRVNDLAAMIDDESQTQLEAALERLETDTGAQLVVLTVPSLEGEVLEDYALKVASTWRLGRKGADDGVLVLVAKDERRIRIEVGYGLEGAIPDVTAKRIIDGIMTPSFREGDFTGGITEATDALAGLIRGETVELPEAGQASDAPLSLKIVAALTFFVVIGTFSVTALFGKGGQSWFLYLFLMPFYGAFPIIFLGPFGLILLAAWVVGFPIIRILTWHSGWGRSFRSSHPGWVTFASSSGGSSGGGGFSGGGGSFGGGGASGGW